MWEVSRVIDRGVGEVVLCAAGARAAGVMRRILSEEVRCFSQLGMYSVASGIDGGLEVSVRCNFI